MTYISLEHHQRVIAEKDALIEELKMCVAKLETVLRLAATDYWREQLDALDSDIPATTIINSTVAQWYQRSEEGLA